MTTIAVRQPSWRRGIFSNMTSYYLHFCIRINLKKPGQDGGYWDQIILVLPSDAHISCRIQKNNSKGPSAAVGIVHE